MATLSERVGLLVKYSGLKQRQLSELAGLSPAVVGQWCRGRARSPDSGALAKLTGATGCSLQWLLLGTAPAPTEKQVRTAVARAQRKVAA